MRNTPIGAREWPRLLPNVREDFRTTWRGVERARGTARITLQGIHVHAHVLHFCGGTYLMHAETPVGNYSV